MKLIGIDARLIHQTGVGVYTRNLLYYIQESNNIDGLQFIVYLPPEEECQNIALDPRIFTKKHINIKWHSVAEQTQFLNILNRDQLSLMHFTYFSIPLFYRKKFIITIHDIIPLIHATGKASTHNPFLYQVKKNIYKFILAHEVFNSQKIIVPSESVAESLVKSFPHLDVNKISSLYEGLDYEFNDEGAKEPEFIPSQPYFLYVGNFYPHKNVDRLLSAFAKIENKDCVLVLCGPEDYFAERVKNKIVELKLGSRVILYHNSSISERKYLYMNAHALVHPSIAEGFGLPLIEAQSVGCHIIASDIPVFNELLGKKARYFNPQSIQSIYEALEESLAKKSSRSRHILDSNTFSFKKMTDATIKLYHSYS